MKTRDPSSSDYSLPVEGLGLFIFAKRAMRDEFRIGAEYSRLTEGVQTPTPWLDLLATATATLKVLAVQVPEGWDIDAMDPYDPESTQQIIDVYSALRSRETTFRRGHGAIRQEGRAGDGQDPGILVPPQVPAAAD